MTEQELLKAHIRDLDRQAFERDITKSTGFLSLSEQAVFYETRDSLFRLPVLAGGYDDADRRMLIWPAAYDENAVNDRIALLRIVPLNAKFSEALTHRDFLGALMNLGIERDRLGDILIAENEGYVFCTQEMAAFITENLRSVKHTPVCCTVCEGNRPELRPRLEEMRINVASERMDALIAAVFRLSRSEAAEKIMTGSVFADGRLIDSNSYKLKEGVRVSVRGFGKFIYDGIGNETRKGRLYVRIRLYL